MRVWLSALAFDVLWQHHDLGEKPPALAMLPSPGRTLAERGELERLAWQELAPYGELPEMALFRTPPVAYCGWFDHGGRSGSVHVAVGRTSALRAVVDQNRVGLETVPAAQAVEALISVLPPMPPGRGAVYSMPERPPRQDTLLVQAHPEDPDQRRCRALLEQPRTGAGFFVSATRDHHGQRRTGATVQYFDTGGGRYLCARRVASTGEPWLVVGPATASDLVNRLRGA